MILAEDPLVRGLAEVMHAFGHGCRIDAEFERTCSAWTPDPHEAEAAAWAASLRAKPSAGLSAQLPMLDPRASDGGSDGGSEDRS